MCMCVGGGGFFKGFPLPVSIPEGETCYHSVYEYNTLLNEKTGRGRDLREDRG